MVKETYINKYNDDGVVVIPGVFAKSEIDKIRACSFMALTKLNEIKHRGYRHNQLETISSGGVEFPSIIFWPSLVENYLNMIRIDIRLNSIAKSILGDNIKQLNNQIYYRLPGDNDNFAYHQDIMFRYPRYHYPNIVEKNAYLQTSIVCDEMDENNAPIHYIIGSHKYGDLNLVNLKKQHLELRESSIDNVPEQVKDLPVRSYNAKPGDVIIWSALNIHGSSGNKSNRSRIYYMNGFCSSSNSKAWPDYMINGEIINNIDANKIP